MAAAGSGARALEWEPSEHALRGPTFELAREGQGYPEAFLCLDDPPAVLYGVGNPAVLGDGLAVIGARKATPYGLACARRFATRAAESGVTVVSGGALGCDSAAHRAALAAGAPTVVVLGGGCDRLYPQRNASLFQQVVDAGGAVVSERHWDYPPMPYAFRARNRLIAALARATLIVEAGMPSGTFSTADDALALGRDVWAVPGAITSPTSRGANRLIGQGAVPIIDDESFEDALVSTFDVMRIQSFASAQPASDDPLLAALRANPMRIDELLALDLPCPGSKDRLTWLMVHLAELERDGVVARFPDGRYGPSRI